MGPRVFTAWILFLVTALALRAEAETLLERFEKLDKEERYSDLIHEFEQSHKALAELNGREAYLLMDSYYGVDDYQKVMQVGEYLQARGELNEFGARIYIYSSRDVNRVDDGLALGLEWLKKNPPGKGIYKAVALACSDKADFKNAQKYAQLAYDLGPDDQRAAGILAYCIARVEGIDAAFKFHKDQAAKFGTLEPYFMVQFAKGIYDLKAFDRLLPVLELILKDDPSNVDASRMKVASLRRMGKLDESLHYGEEWGARYKADAIWCNDFGTTLFLKKDYAKAKEWFEQAVRWDDWYSTAVENLLVTYNELDEYGKTIEYAALWKQKHGSAWTSKMDKQVGNSLTWLQLYDLAEIYYRRVYDKDAETAENVRDLMFVCRKQNRPAEAIALGRAWLTRHKPSEEDGEDIVTGLEKAQELLDSQNAKAAPAEAPKPVSGGQTALRPRLSRWPHNV